MADSLGVTDATPTGAQGTPDPVVEPKERSINSQAKELPWVQDALRKSAELDRMVAEKEKADAEAERRAAESKGEYEKALKLEQEKTQTLETKYQTEVKLLKLDAALAHAGLNDPRLVSLFVDGYDVTTDVAEYVETIKADPKNAAFFGKQRKVVTPPRPGEEPPVEDFVPERDLDNWLRSKDPKKRERAIAHNLEKYKRQLNKSRG